MDSSNAPGDGPAPLGKTLFTMLAVLPLILFLCALNRWLPGLDNFEKIDGVPFSIIAVLILLTSQVILAWLYLALYEKKEGENQ